MTNLTNNICDIKVEDMESLNKLVELNKYDINPGIIKLRDGITDIVYPFLQEPKMYRSKYDDLIYEKLLIIFNQLYINLSSGKNILTRPGYKEIGKPTVWNIEYEYKATFENKFEEFINDLSNGAFRIIPLLLKSNDLISNDSITVKIKEIITKYFSDDQEFIFIKKTRGFVERKIKSLPMYMNNDKQNKKIILYTVWAKYIDILNICDLIKINNL